VQSTISALSSVSHLLLIETRAIVITLQRRLGPHRGRKQIFTTETRRHREIPCCLETRITSGARLQDIVIAELTMDGSETRGSGSSRLIL
jgi:hypothetical protein